MGSGNRSSRAAASPPSKAMSRVVPHQGTREVGIIVFNDVLLLDATGPADIFSRANHHICYADQPARYRLTALSTFGGEIATSSGLRLQLAALPSPEIC